MAGSNGKASLRRTGGIAGIVFAVGIVVALVLGADQPSASDSIGSIRSYIADSATRIYVFDWLVGAAFVFPFLVFASALRSEVAGVDDDSAMWGRTSFAGAIVAATAAGFGVAFTSVLAEFSGDYSDSTVRMLASMDNDIYTTVVPWGMALFLIGASIGILRGGGLWRWLGWLGSVLALVLVVGSFWLIQGDTESALASVAWIGVTGSLLWALLAGAAMISVKESVVSEPRLEV